MKKLLLFLILMLLVTASACAESRILVACFSVTGNTAPIAKLAAEVLNADYYVIVPKTPYTDADIQYSNNSCRANREQRDNACRPAIAGEALDMSGYDTVLIAYPIWWGEEPRIIDTFMETYNLSGKALATFCTSGGSGIGTAERHLRALAPDSSWLGAKRFQVGADRSTVQSWLNSIGIEPDEPKEEAAMMKLEIGSAVLYAGFADTDAARELQTRLTEGSVTIDVSNYGGWEKVGDLPWALPADDEQITAQPGDIMLYAGHSMVLFYGNNSWAYTRLGHIVSFDANELRGVLGGNERRLTLSLAE
ncbi:MAG: hypothetical protein MJ136_08150 [Clostridia bacterium]|nr:hypothetical protein [Clostridia bacterium]